MQTFLDNYTILNGAQKKAVDTIEGPVMVIAGPGTGKTQVLALRIANILTKTDTPPDGVVCLTFTTAGVKAMRERLLKYIGPTAMKVRISTFHSFALEMIELWHTLLGFETIPTLLDDAETVTLFDELLNSREWQYVRPRANTALYFRDLVSFIGVLKRDRISPDTIRAGVDADITRLERDPDSISTRGETKGQLKKEIQKTIESLRRTREAADFYAAYEAIKNERLLMDYNDVLTYLVKLVEEHEVVRDTLRERFLYVLVDEHQDSSGIQNEFLERVWGDVEQPNLFVVGDDRQLIYGFGGASLAYFETFKERFGRVTLITLTENYRSTQTVLNAAESLLQSTLATGKLTGDDSVSHPLELIECDYPRDEIIAAGLSYKEKAAAGLISLDECAILVPKNRQVKSAIQVLRDIGLPVAARSSLALFTLPETIAFLTVLRIVASPFDAVALNKSIFDPMSGVSVLSAHRFIFAHQSRKITLSTLIEDNDLSINAWGTKLEAWVNTSVTHDAYSMIQIIGDDCFLGSSTDTETVRTRVEIMRTLLHLVLSQVERGTAVSLADFLAFVDRLRAYGEDIPLAVFAKDAGIKVLTLHGSKGLEYDAVWIAHMDERSLMSTKRDAFLLPEVMAEKRDESDEAIKKRELYVAMTRAKRYLTISYARTSYTGVAQTLASIIEALPPELFVRSTAAQSESAILATDPKIYSARTIAEDQEDALTLATLVAVEYTSRKVSVTMLNNFFECPWKWYFRSLLQLPEPENESLQIGNIVHKVIDHVLKSRTASTPETVRVFIEKTCAVEARYDTPVAARYIRTVIPIIEGWMKRSVPAIVQPFSTERALSYQDPEFAHLSLFGKIDLVEEIITGEVRVTDWKTGSSKTKGDIEKTDEEGRLSPLLRQLAMYSYLLEGMTHGTTSVNESRLVFLEAKEGDKNSVHSRRIDRDDIERLRNDIRDYDTLVKNGDWIHRPCTTKTYGVDEVCEYCAMAERYTLIKTPSKKEYE